MIYITDAETLSYHIPDILCANVIGLDLETAGKPGTKEGLDPFTGKIRLLQLATENEVYVIDCFRIVLPNQYVQTIIDRAPKIIIQNGAFDWRFLMQNGINIPNGDRLFDTMLAGKLLGAGTEDGTRKNNSLKALAARYLKEDIDKENQLSDWGINELSASQLTYAAKDATILLPLHEILGMELEAAGMNRIAEIEFRALPAFVWMIHSGVKVDTAAWSELAHTAGRKKWEVEQELGKELGPLENRTMSMFDENIVNWDSPTQVLKILRGRGHKIPNTEEDTLAQISDKDKLVPLILKQREYAKKTGTYGLGFLDYIHPKTKRIHAEFDQLGSDAGRTSCANPNLQQVPTETAYRSCIIAPEGRVLCKSDYSGIEFRIAAHIANERRVIGLYAEDPHFDIHTLTTQVTLGKDKVTKEERKYGKSQNFGRLFGMNDSNFRIYAKKTYGVDFTKEQAAAAGKAFFNAYPDFVSWHNSEKGQSGETRSLAGRRRLDVSELTKRLNTPVQATAADGVKIAMGLLWENRSLLRGAKPVMLIHDEIVIESAEETARENVSIVEMCMISGMESLLTKVPVVVESKIWRTWGDDA